MMAKRKLPKSSRKALADYSEEEIIELIDEIVGHNPKVMAAVKGVAKSAKSGKAKDAAAYRDQARRAMRGESSRAIERELKATIICKSFARSTRTYPRCRMSCARRGCKRDWLPA